MGNMDGTGSFSNFMTGLNTPIGVAVDYIAGKVYWSERDAGLIRRANLDGSGLETVLSGLNSPRYISLNLPIIGEFLWDDSSGDGLWNTATNWLGDSVPPSAADVGFKTNYGTGAESVNVNINPTVQSINIDNPTAYTLNNNTITFSNNGGSVGIFVDDTNGTPGSPITHTINSAITLSNDASIDNMTTGANTNLALNGNISIAGNDLTINTDGGGIEIGGSSVISSGTGGDIIKTGTGDLTVNSSGTMTFLGNVEVNAGTYTMQNATALGDSIVGSTTIASGGSLIMELSGNNTVDEALTVSGTGSSGQGAIVHNNLTSGITTMRGDSRFNGGTLISSTAGTLSFDADTQRLQSGVTTFNTSTGSIEFTGTSLLHGTGGLTKTGTGTMTLSSSTANTYEGTTTVSAGVLEIQSTTSLGTTAGDTRVLSGGTLSINLSGTSTVSENLIIRGTGSGGQGAVYHNSSGTTNWDGTVFFDNDALITSNAGTLNFRSEMDLDKKVLTFNTDGGDISIDTTGTITSSSSGDIIKTETGTLTISNSAANTYAGTTTVSAGVLEIQSTTALGNTATGTIVESGGTLELNTPFGTISESSYTIAGTGSSSQGAVTLTSGNSAFVSGTVTLNANATISSESGFLLLNGNTSLGSNTLTVNPSTGTLGFGNDNVISGTGGIIKTGASIATYRQTGTTNNTYTGLTEVQAGTLSTSASIDGLTLIPGDIKLTGGTLALLHDNNVADTSNVEMAGGKLRIQAGGSGSTNVSDTFNTLTLTEDSTIELNHVGVSGVATIVLNFADSSGTSWTSGKTLAINNWTGTVGSGGGEDQIFFDNNTSGLTTTQLSQITFEDVNGLIGNNYAAKILSTGEIIPFVPVPEPSTIITGGLALLFIGYLERKRLLALWKWFQKKRTGSA